jgi:hypothetical protein
VSEKVVARGAWFGWRLPSLAASGCGGLLVLVSIFALSFARLPWTIRGSEKLFAEAPLATTSVVVFALAASYVIAKSVFVRGAGRVEMDDEGIVFQRGLFLKTRVAWSALEGFSDASSGRVDLVKKGESFARPELAIPTGDDATRAAVLAALDAHGLRRVEVSPRGRRLVRAAVAGAVAVAAFPPALHVANWPYRRLHELNAVRSGMCVPDDFVADCVTLRHRFRTVIGTDDALFVETRARYPGVPAFFVPEESLGLSVLTEVAIDGEVVQSTRSSGNTFSYKLGGWEWIAEMLEGYDHDRSWLLLAPSAHRLTPGRHRLRIASGACIGLSTCEKWTDTQIDVVPGSAVASAIKVVHGEKPKVTVAARAYGSSAWDLIANHEQLPHAIAARVELLENGRTIMAGTFLTPELTPAGRTIKFESVFAPRLPRGHHALTARFTPDPKLAFENDVEITEILGFETFEREFVVDAP